MSLLNNTTSPAIRTTIQAAVSELIIRGAEVFPDPDLAIDTSDRVLLLVVVTGAVSLVQNFAENHMGRSILVPQRTDPGAGA